MGELFVAAWSVLFGPIPLPEPQAAQPVVVIEQPTSVDFGNAPSKSPQMSFAEYQRQRRVIFDDWRNRYLERVRNPKLDRCVPRSHIKLAYERFCMRDWKLLDEKYQQQFVE